MFRWGVLSQTDQRRGSTVVVGGRRREKGDGDIRRAEQTRQVATGVAVAEGDDGLPSGQLVRGDGQGLAGCPAEAGDGDHFDRVCLSGYCVLCISPGCIAEIR
jgi:hypothetical protein